MSDIDAKEPANSSDGFNKVRIFQEIEEINRKLDEDNIILTEEENSDAEKGYWN